MYWIFKTKGTRKSGKCWDKFAIFPLGCIKYIMVCYSDTSMVDGQRLLENKDYKYSYDGVCIGK